MLTVAIVSWCSVQAVAQSFGLYDIKLQAALALYHYRNYNTLLYSVSRTA